MSTFLYKSLNCRYKCLTTKKFSQLFKSKSVIQSFIISSKFSTSPVSKTGNIKEKVNTETQDTTNEAIETKVPNTEIKASQYYTPPSNAVDNDKYYETFWSKYEEQMQRQSEMYKPYLDRIRYKKNYHNPVERTFKILRDDVLEYFGKLKHNSLVRIREAGEGKKSSSVYMKKEQVFPSYCDVAIIGGGIVGTAIAFHLQERAKDGLRVVVIEKDMSYSKASTVLSVGGIRQQFSTPENIILSKYGMDFLQQSRKRLMVDEDDPPRVDVNFNGYLTLATEEGYPQLLENYELQKQNYSFVEMLTKEKLKKKFPWMEVDEIVCGTYGVQREGWFDPWSLLLALNRKSKSLGTEFVNGEVTACHLRPLGDHYGEGKAAMQQVNNVDVTLPDGETRNITCAVVVIAAGAWSQDVGRLCGVGTEREGIRSIPIPVEPRKRFVYCVHAPGGPGLNTPLVVNPDGSYFRREGLADLYLCGMSPDAGDEPPVGDLSVDMSFFEDSVWPSVAKRCPSFERLKVQSSWGGFYDYNTLDQNAIIGRHPLYSNLYVATGFSGHGIQQAAGAGKAISELILDSEMKTLDMSRFGFHRVVFDEPLPEKCVY